MPEGSNDDLPVIEGVVEMSHQALQVEAAHAGDGTCVTRADLRRNGQELSGFLQVVLKDLRTYGVVFPPLFKESNVSLGRRSKTDSAPGHDVRSSLNTSSASISRPASRSSWDASSAR